MKAESKFLTELNLESIRGTNKFKLTQFLAYFSSEKNVTFTVSKDFITDFASIPSAFRGIIDTDDAVIKDAAVIHDMLYSRVGDTYKLTRKQCDEVLREAMLTLGSSKWKASMVYFSVRSCGWMFYKKEKTES
jgi:hypothetical protein